MRTLTAAVEAALSSGDINVVELMRVDLGGGLVLYWSNKKVPDNVSFDGRTYEDRIKRIGKLPDLKGKETVTIWNGDGLIRQLVNSGVRFELADISVCRIFPDLDPPDNVVGDWDSPMWRGYVSKPPTFTEISKMEISQGLREFNRPAGRTYRHSDQAQFADGLHHPYDPMKGKGLPRTKVSGSATGGSSTTLVDTSRDFSALGVQVGWLVFVKVKKIIGRISQVGTDTLTVEEWKKGGSATGDVPASSDSYVVGPQFTDYNLSRQDSINMGMFGQNKQQGDDDLNTDTRRYFYGLTQPGAFLEGSEPIQTPAQNRFGQVGQGGLDGKIINVPIGNCFIPSLDVLAWGVSEQGEFVHVLAAAGEGRVNDITRIEVDGAPPDADVGQVLGANREDSLIKYGVDSPSNADDSDAVASGELTQDQQKQAIGARQSWAVKRREVLDTYKDNPWRMDNASLSGLSAVRVRTQPPDGARKDSQPNVSALIVGGTSIKSPDGVWSHWPDPVQTWYHFMRNTRWGVGRPSNQINTVESSTASAVCRRQVPSSQSQDSTFSSVVAFGPDDADRSTAPNTKNFIAVIDLDIFGFEFVGGELTVETAGGSVTKTVTHVERIEKAPEMVEANEGQAIFVPPRLFRSTLVFLFVDSNFDTAKMPAAGDSFTLKQVSTSVQYLANGNMKLDKKAGEVAEDILKNCNGEMVSIDGKMAPVIREQVDLSVINALPPITDIGAGRNVVKKGSGESTLTYEPQPTEKVPTSVIVEFVDAASNYQRRQFEIRNPFAEKRVKELAGEAGRERRETILSLGLTSSVDQAMRLGALWLRERSFLKEIPNYHPGKYKCVMPIHDAQEYIPVKDVVPVVGKNLPDYAIWMRIKKALDNPDKATFTIEGMPYFDLMYTGDLSDFDVTERPLILDKPPSGRIPERLKIESVTEGTLTANKEGIPSVPLDIKITLPS